MNQTQSAFLETGSILVTDSGVGGLYFLKILLNAFPDEKFVYFSDAKNMPYGNKTSGQIRMYCRNRVEFARNIGAKLVVVACNTMSVIGRDIFLKSGLPVVDVVAADLIKRMNIKRPAVLFCTSATAKNVAISRLSQIYDIRICAQPGLAEQIERNAESLCSFTPRLSYNGVRSIGTVILGCTHYGLIKDKFAAEFDGATIIDGSEDVVARVRKSLYFNGCANKDNGEKTRIIKSGESDRVTFKGSGAERMQKVFRKFLSAGF